jgi:hypothetical protein
MKFLVAMLFVLSTLWLVSYCGKNFKVQKYKTQMMMLKREKNYGK